MKYRVVPNEVYSVMNLNDKFNYLWNPDPITSLLGLGNSYVLEFFEFFGQEVGDYYDKFISDPRLKDERFPVFIAQEKRHAAAHRKLNAFMTKDHMAPPSREKYHPRVFDFMYVHYKMFAERILGGIAQEEAAGRKADGLFFKEAIRIVGVFESQVCVSSFTFFDSISDDATFKKVMDASKNLSMLYLFGYHFIEEMEHCSISIEAFETIYNETLWTDEMVHKYVDSYSIMHDPMVHNALVVARMLNIDLTVQQIESSSAFQSRIQKQKHYLKKGFNAREPEIRQRIDYFINKWDNEWEPMLLERIKSQIKSARAA